MRVVTGEAKGKKLKSPKTVGTRPIMDRVKTALFDILAPEIQGTYFLDLFAGTGGVGIEALSRGAQRATFIEMSPPIVKLVRENLQITAMTAKAEVIHGDSFKFLQAYQLKPASQAVSRDRKPVGGGLQRGYNILYIAPPQYEEMAAKALQMTDSSSLMAEDALVIIQIHPKERPGVAAIAPLHLDLIDERRYGSTLLMFYRRRSTLHEVTASTTSTDATDAIQATAE
ncbi:16S rRNA (guanine(966)-N(2))-methyltransferase RsmD [Tengunoibacter tsumagoiensis]|uniref:Methyltransferase n=1 Tax=Tengunoibacter tsumagoiensis TaxID=2014871 RepID=A0A401ZU30_9CHLR|nr:16S rRNA (guanine(966)-N(2))-methyltransferase RsmD [Tengunoibacter tsumagoiensis]GCE10280.1 methyltransferase [Tengunoibacter tsumagoiensis]